MTADSMQLALLWFWKLVKPSQLTTGTINMNKINLAISKALLRSRTATSYLTPLFTAFTRTINAASMFLHIFVTPLSLSINRCTLQFYERLSHRRHNQRHFWSLQHRTISAAQTRGKVQPRAHVKFFLLEPSDWKDSKHIWGEPVTTTVVTCFFGRFWTTNGRIRRLC